MGLGKIFKKIKGPLIAGTGLLGMEIYGNYSKGKSRDKYADELRRQAEADYERQKELHGYNTQYNQDLAKWQFEDSAARRAAAAQTERNRQAAARRGQRIMDQAYTDSRATFQPWADTGTRLLPQAEKTYGNALGSMNLLNAYLFKPENLARLNSTTPAFNVDIPLDNYFAGAKRK